VSVKVAKFEIKRHFSVYFLLYKTNRFRVAVRLFSDGYAEGVGIWWEHQWHTRLRLVCHFFCSCHVLTSSVISCWTDARQHGIYLLNDVSQRRYTRFCPWHDCTEGTEGMCGSQKKNYKGSALAGRWKQDFLSMHVIFLHLWPKGRESSHAVVPSMEVGWKKKGMRGCERMLIFQTDRCIS